MHGLGVSQKMIQLLHHAVMQPKGIAPFERYIEDCRKSRYMQLARQHVDMVRKLQQSDALYVAPKWVTIAEYMEIQRVPCYDYLITTWLAYTEPFVYLSLASMEMAKVKSCLRMDGTFKFGNYSCFILNSIPILIIHREKDYPE